MTPMATWRGYSSGWWRPQLAPIVVWLGAIGGVAWLIGERGQGIGAVGLARGEQRQLAALSAGRVSLVAVRPFEEVQKGETLVLLEDDRIRAALATAAAETSRLRAELQAAEARLAADAAIQEFDYIAEARRFALDIEQTRVDILELTVRIETGKIRIQRQKIELDRLQKLRPQDAASPYEYELAVADYAAAVKEVEANETTLAQLKLDLDEANVRQRDMEARHGGCGSLDQMLNPLRAAVAVQESRIAEMSIERAGLVLYCPIDGAVADIAHGEGEVVLAGDPILTVVASRPSQVVAYITAAEAERIEPGDPLQVHSLGRRVSTKSYDSYVVAVGPAVVQLPIQLWRSPAVPEWGCPVQLAMPAEATLRCDETVAVRYRTHDFRSRSDTPELEQSGDGQW